jgi:hypothetical protein
MESFNAELNAELNRLHPKSREFIDQSLRGGTQTPGHFIPSRLAIGEQIETADRRSGGTLYRRTG